MRSAAGFRKWRQLAAVAVHKLTRLPVAWDACKRFALHCHGNPRLQDSDAALLKHILGCLSGGPSRKLRFALELLYAPSPRISSASLHACHRQCQSTVSDSETLASSVRLSSSASLPSGSETHGRICQRACIHILRFRDPYWGVTLPAMLAALCSCRRQMAQGQLRASSATAPGKLSQTPSPPRSSPGDSCRFASATVGLNSRVFEPKPPKSTSGQGASLVPDSSGFKCAEAAEERPARCRPSSSCRPEPQVRALSSCHGCAISLLRLCLFKSHILKTASDVAE